MEKIVKKYVPKMHCASCELLVREAMEMGGAKKIKVDVDGKCVTYCDGDEEKIEKKLLEYGYELCDSKSNTALNKETMIALIISVVFAGGLVFLEKIGVLRMGDFGQINWIIVFGIGVVASLSSCMAVTGGLLLSLNSIFPEKRKEVMLEFLGARTIGFGLLGAFIGLLGNRLAINSTVQSWLQIGMGGVMIFLGLNNLGITRSISLPLIFGKKILNWKNNNKAWWLPMALGVLTFVLPCGFTQSMQLYALGLGNPIKSGLTMLTFALGTLPILAAVSAISIKFNKGRNGEIFFKTVGFLLIAFGVWQVWVGGR